MATVTVVNAERTLAIEATSIVAAAVNTAGHLILTRHDGTDIDAGAVSGMQLDGGTTYSKVDAFTYVGDTDPGAVPNGSVWLDTTDVAGPFASDTQKGLVELATNAETLAGTDATRAVTPASLEAKSQTRVLDPANFNNNTLGSVYPLGESYLSFTTTQGSTAGWEFGSKAGTIRTYRRTAESASQLFIRTHASTTTPEMWFRGGDESGWGIWREVSGITKLTPASFIQTTLFSAYPIGWSRLYYSSTNSSGWDFNGKYGEVLTYVDGTDFAKQTWTRHSSGGAIPEMWIRSANAANGWTAWRKILTDPDAWTSYTPTWSTSSGINTPTFGNATISCSYIKIGRKVDVRFEITFGSTTNFGGGGGTDNWQFTLPVDAARTSDTVGFLDLAQSSTAAGLGRAKLHSTTGFRISVIAGSTANVGTDVDSIQPFTWASGNSIKGLLTYESAA